MKWGTAVAAVAFLPLWCVGHAASQAVGEIQCASRYNRPVSDVEVQGRWATQVPLPIGPGDILTPEKISAALHALRTAITAEPVYGYSARSAGEIGVLILEVDCHQRPDAPGDTVALTFRPRYIRISLKRIGDNVLPIPRSAQPSFLENVPKPLLALNPTFSASHDRRFGSSLGAAVQTDLLNFGKPGAGNKHFDLQAHVLKSVEHTFHRASAGLRYGERRSGSALLEYYLRGDVADIDEPLGTGKHAREAAGLGAGVTLKVAPTARLSLDTGYRHTRDTVDAGARMKTNEQTNRVLLDALPPPVYGFFRAAVWQDNAWQSGVPGSYQRLAGRIGYAKEIAFQPNHALGVEVIAGAGKAWGRVPEHARFFAGNAPGQFLYDAPSSANQLNMPAGPLLRSFGENQAGLRAAGGALRGADRYWHVNVNLAIPIRRWSRPLIPDDATGIPDPNDGPDLTLKQYMKRQVDVSGPNLLQAWLEKEGMSSADAFHEAQKVVAEIKPATHYIIDDANLYSIRPMLMLDAAGLTDGNGAHPTWIAGGVGIQFTIVTAKFEGGYMRTLSGPTFGSRGNLFFRVVFQNLF
jgi:hypothetical protein